MLMEIQITHQAETKVACDALVVAVAAEKKAGQKAKSVVLSEVAKTLDEALGGVISEMCANGEIKASLGELNTIHTLGKLAAKRVVIVGLGPRQALSTEALRRASAIATRHLQHTGAHEIAFALNWPGSGVDEIAGAQAQGLNSCQRMLTKSLSTRQSNEEVYSPRQPTLPVTWSTNHLTY